MCSKIKERPILIVRVLFKLLRGTFLIIRFLPKLSSGASVPQNGDPRL